MGNGGKASHEMTKRWTLVNHSQLPLKMRRFGSLLARSLRAAPRLLAPIEAAVPRSLAPALAAASNRGLLPWGAASAKTSMMRAAPSRGFAAEAAEPDLRSLLRSEITYESENYTAAEVRGGGKSGCRTGVAACV